MTNEVESPAGTSASATSGDQSTANPAHAEDDNHDADADALPQDEEASYCSTTSEESLAHSDADEDEDEAGEAGDTIASPTRTSSARRTVRTPSFSYDDLARRPRSNPRTRTPLRNPSPLLQGLRREQHVAAAAAETNAARNVPGTQSPEIRPAPQDAGSLVTNVNGSGTENVAVSSPQAQTQPQPQPQQQRVTIRLNAGLPVGSLPSSSASTARASATSLTATRRNAHQTTTAQRSTKQGPSRRKIRRWTNDSMRSIAVDLARSNTRGSLAAADVYARGVSDGELRRQYEMPNAPRNYRSSFDVLTRLVDRWELDDVDHDDNEDGGEEDPLEEEREDHLLGGGGRVGDVVGNNSRRKKKEDDAHRKKKEEMERKKKRAELLAARDKFLRGETAAAALNHSVVTSSSNDESRFSSGTAMFRHLDPRIRSIVIRAVSSTSPSSPVVTTTYAAKLLNAMEDLLVHRKMASDESRKLVDEILARPLVVDTSSGDAHVSGNAHADHIEIEDDKSNKADKKTKKKNKKDKKAKNKSRNKNKVGSMAYRFHFKATATNNGPAGNKSEGGGKNAGFHRLLLHAVCQFHGMNASSSTCSYRGGEDERQKTAMERVLMVTGTCRGREHRIVDEACRYMVEDS